MAGAEDLMLPVQRVEMDTGDLDVSATIGHLYTRHRPRVRRLARARVDGGPGAGHRGPRRGAAVPVRRPVHRDLLAADPATGITVAAIARR
ncbi:MAG TPA: hypothetical protein VFQ68_01085 [Streptosporangiaceae bacterium]|nr:hypothetical protein [Streptosporangiaceae bacterium]